MIFKIMAGNDPAIETVVAQISSMLKKGQVLTEITLEDVPTKQEPDSNHKVLVLHFGPAAEISDKLEPNSVPKSNLPLVEIKCSNCGHPLPNGKNICTTCGHYNRPPTATEEVRKCENCGNPLPERGNVCSICRRIN